MTTSNPDDDRAEAELRQLFDASAETLSGPLLTRVRARAAEVPNRRRRAPLWFPRWAWAPSAAGLAAAVGALAVTFGSWFAEPDTDVVPAGASPMAAAAPREPSAAMKALPDVVRQTTADPDAPPRHAAAEHDRANELLLEAGESELEVLQALPADADLDAWLYATALLLEDEPASAGER